MTTDVGITGDHFQTACKRALDEYGQLLVVLIGEEAYSFDSPEFSKFMALIALYMKQEYNKTSPPSTGLRAINGS